VKGKNGFEFNFNLKNVPFGNYYLGRIVNNNMSDMRPVVLGLEDKIYLKGSCNAIQQLAFVDSKVNSLFEAMVDSIKVHGNQFMELITEFQQNIGNKEKQASIKKAMSEIDFRRKELYNKLKKEQPELAKIAALYTYQSYQNNQKNPQQTEGQYVAESYFQFADLTDSSYIRVAFFYESVKSYATSLSQSGLTQEQLQAYLDQMLTKVGIKNPQYQPALLASAFGVIASNKKLFLYYAEQYQKMYRGKNQMLDNFLDQQISQLKSSTEIGDEAPDFSAATPEGGTKSLKSLRGKVLLVDFWASWCGPCRRENPNVVAVYNKYKDKGFDVLGVSLDQDATRWKSAIEQDKLSWHHVSDLGGWGSAPAKLYKVTGIPQTLLLDKNGVIIAKNLRGPALEEKLKEIFGE
jgi:peroxiredoxin